MSHAVVTVEHVSKKFCKSLKRSMLYGIQDIVKNIAGLPSGGSQLRPREFWAVDEVDFELKKGEALGIIGPNGSGKSTLLKMLNGIFMPDKGRITICGRVGALIEVGAGFHPMLTGRENVYVNGAILGMTKSEIDRKFAEIVTFADIGDFIDVAVKHYSSGMYVRLGFAVAVYCEPDILLVDEVLAVGDMNFRHKCLSKIGEMVDQQVSVIIVSHNLEEITRVTERLILLDNGKALIEGESLQVINKYFTIANNHSRGEESYHTEILDVVQFNLVDAEGHEVEIISNEEELTVKATVVTKTALSDVSLSYGLWSNANIHVAGSASSWDFQLFSLSSGIHELSVTLPLYNLKEGLYFLDFGVWDKNLLKCYVHARRFRSIHIENVSKKFSGIVDLKPRWGHSLQRTSDKQ
jgi:lipopolysaccharide transport system ATP-binding protein